MIFRTSVVTLGILFASASFCAATDGADVYKAQCAKCHGDTGQSDTTVGKAMKVPPLAGDPKVAKMSEAEVVAKITGNEKHPPTVKAMSAEDIAAAATFVKTLAK